MKDKNEPLRLKAFLMFSFSGAAILLGTAMGQENSMAQTVSQQNCIGAPPYNCYPQGDIDPIARQGTYDQLYAAYAAHAWQDFFALNFPADQVPNEGTLPQPSSTNGLDFSGGQYTTVWETFIEARDMFRPDGSRPLAFGADHELPDACMKFIDAEGGVKPRYLVSRFTKASPNPVTTPLEVLDEYIQANRMGPVVDQNGSYLRFGINFNSAMYDYVVKNVLYNEQGQEKFDTIDPNPNRDKSPINWPRGVFLGDGKVDPNQVGAVMVKAAWKILASPADDFSRYHRVEAVVYNEPGGAFGDEPEVKESCSRETIGLVGFHIAHRTNSAPQWVWSTFEHIDNAPWIHDFKAGTPSGPYALFDPQKCPANPSGKPNCAYNKLPDHPWDPARPVAQEPTQVVRIGAPGKHAITANAANKTRLQKAYGMGKTVWENYFLVDVQFPTQVLPPDAKGAFQTDPAYPDGLPTPSFLANSTIETFIQGFTAGDITSNGNAVPDGDQMLNVGQDPRIDPWNAGGTYGVGGGAQRNTSSCIACHGDAALRTGTSGGFVFSMSRAASTPQEPAPGK